MKKRQAKLTPDQAPPTPPLLIRFLIRHPVTSALLCALLLFGILIGLPFATKPKAPNANELVKISGHVRAIERTKTKQRHSKPIIYLNIHEDLRTFEISGSGYSAVRGLKTLTPGKKVEFSIRKDESESMEYNPTIYELRTDSNLVLSLSDYKDKADTSNRKTLYLGIFGFLGAIILFFIRLRSKD